jgi:hypothetical protein
MAITRTDLLKELLPGLNELFGLEYSKYTGEANENKHEIQVDFDRRDDPVPIRELWNDDGA